MFNKIIKFIKEWGLYGIMALTTFYSPLWIGYLIQNEKLIEIGLWWTALWALPILTPAWLVIIGIAGIYKGLWKLFETWRNKEL